MPCQVAQQFQLPDVVGMVKLHEKQHPATSCRSLERRNFHVKFSLGHQGNLFKDCLMQQLIGIHYFSMRHQAWFRTQNRLGSVSKTAQVRQALELLAA